MSASPLKDDIQAAMKAAMRAREKPRLQTIRLIQAEFKRIEVDERIELDEARVLSILDKMVKQRRDSQKQYEDAGREDQRAQPLVGAGPDRGPKCAWTFETSRSSCCWPPRCSRVWS